MKWKALGATVLAVAMLAMPLTVMAKDAPEGPSLPPKEDRSEWGTPIDPPQPRSPEPGRQSEPVTSVQPLPGNPSGSLRGAPEPVVISDVDELLNQLTLTKYTDLSTDPRQQRFTWPDYPGALENRVNLLTWKPGSYKLGADLKLNETEFLEKAHEKFGEFAADLGLFHVLGGFSLDGQNHTITMENGDKPNRPLFVSVGGGAADTILIQDLKLHFPGDVLGAPFAASLYSGAAQTNQSLIRNITVTVDKNVLPLTMFLQGSSDGSGPCITANGFVFYSDNFSYDNITIDIKGDIGGKKQDSSDHRESSHSRVSGFGYHIASSTLPTLSEEEIKEAISLKAQPEEQKKYLEETYFSYADQKKSAVRFSYVRDLSLTVGGNIIGGGKPRASVSAVCISFDIIGINIRTKIGGSVYADFKPGKIIPSGVYTGHVSGSFLNYGGLIGSDITIDGRVGMQSDSDFFVDDAQIFLAPHHSMSNSMNLCVGSDVTMKQGVYVDKVHYQNRYIYIHPFYQDYTAEAGDSSEPNDEKGCRIICNNNLTLGGESRLKSQSGFVITGLFEDIHYPFSDMMKKQEVNSLYNNNLTIDKLSITSEKSGVYLALLSYDLSTSKPKNIAIEKSKIKVNSIETKVKTEKARTYIGGAYNPISRLGENGKKLLAYKDIDIDIGNINSVSEGNKSNASLTAFSLFGKNYRVENLSASIKNLSYEMKGNSGTVLMGGLGCYASNVEFVDCRSTWGKVSSHSPDSQLFTYISPLVSCMQGTEGSLTRASALVTDDIVAQSKFPIYVGGISDSILKKLQAENCAVQFLGDISLTADFSCYFGGLVAGQERDNESADPVEIDLKNCSALVMGKVNFHVPANTGAYCGGLVAYSNSGGKIENSAAALDGEVKSEGYLSYGTLIGRAAPDSDSKALALKNCTQFLRPAELEAYTEHFPINPNNVYASNWDLSQLFVTTYDDQKLENRKTYTIQADDVDGLAVSPDPIYKANVVKRSFQEPFWGKNPPETSVPEKDFYYITQAQDNSLDQLSHVSPSTAPTAVHPVDNSLNKLHLYNIIDRHLMVTNSFTSQDHTFAVDLFGLPGSPITVTYDGNGNTAGEAPVDDKKYAGGEAVTLAGKDTLEKSDYAFAGWALKPDPGPDDTIYQPDQTYTLAGDPVTFYAQWAPVTYKVIYDPNGGTGTPPTDDKAYKKGETVTVAAPGELKYEGYTFLGWSTDKTATEATYQPNDTLKMGDSDLILYAIWKKNEPAPGPGPEPEPEPGPGPSPKPGPVPVIPPMPGPVTPPAPTCPAKQDQVPKTGERSGTAAPVALALAGLLTVVYLQSKRRSHREG